MSTSTRFRDPLVDDAFGHWLAGFVDGEGNFQAHNRGVDKGGFCFRIILREDDKPVLETIRERLGVGALYLRDIAKDSVNWKANAHRDYSKTRNQWAYIVQPVVDLIQVVVPFFRRYPLRAKKAEQFRVWSDALMQTRAYRLFMQREDFRCAF